MAKPLFKPADQEPNRPDEGRNNDEAFVNPPTYTEFGGFTGPEKARRNTQRLRLGRPGETKS